MDAATGFAIGAAALMGAGLLLYSNGRASGAGWTGWACGQIAILLLLLRVGAPQLALLAPGLGAACALPLALRGRVFWPGAASELALPGAVFLWLLLLVGPAGDLTMTAEIGPVFGLLSGLVALAAGWRLLAGTCTESRRGRSLAWFLWSAAYGMVALALMAARIDWPFLVFPLLAQGLNLVAGMVTLGGGDSVAVGRIAAPDQADAAF